MSGRSSNRRGGRGGRGNRKSPTTTKKIYKKKTIEDYYFYVGSNKQASDFEITSEFVINHIKKTFERGNDVSESLRLLQKMDTETWKPVLMVSEESNKTLAAREDKQFEMDYKAELDEYLRRKRLYESNLYKAYALLWERSAKAMQNRIMARSDFESRIYNDPIELLKAIKEHALNYQETRYDMSIISDAFRSVFYTKQKEGESLQDYTRRFKTSCDILESHIGSGVVL